MDSGQSTGENRTLTHNPQKPAQKTNTFPATPSPGGRPATGRTHTGPADVAPA